MLDLLDADQPREIIVPPLQPLTCPPPTVRAALAVLKASEALEESGGGELPERAASVLSGVCSDWLPLRTYSTLFGRAFSDRRRVQVLSAVLGAGTPDRLKSEDTEGGRDSYSWDALIARYRSAYGLTLQETLEERWHWFLSQLKEIGTIDAQEQVRFIRAYTALRSEDGDDIIDSILKQARPGAQSEPEEDLTEEERQERQTLKDKMMAEAYQTRQHILN